MTGKTLPLAVLAAALTGSIAWASSREDGPASGWMMTRYGSGMMGYAPTRGGEPVTDLPGARRQAERFADRLDLEVGEVMRFANNYYAELEEEDGRLATEVLVDPETGAVSLEYGPAMMWNTRFGMMSDYRLRNGSGMMGSGTMGGMGMIGSGMMGGDPTFAPAAAGADGEVSAPEAERIAGAWLRRERARHDRRRGGRVPRFTTPCTCCATASCSGWLSVNASTGAVWYHSWHGRFVSMTE